MTDNKECNPERFKDLAYSNKDLEAQQRQRDQKMLRILRELEKRISILEKNARVP